MCPLPEMDAKLKPFHSVLHCCAGCGMEAGVRFTTCLLVCWCCHSFQNIFFKKCRHVQCKNRSRKLECLKHGCEQIAAECSLWLSGGWTFRNKDSQSSTWIDSVVRDIAACSLGSWLIYNMWCATLDGFPIYSSSTAQGGGGSFTNRKLDHRRDWLLWVNDGRAKTLMDRTVQLCNWLTD